MALLGQSAAKLNGVHPDLRSVIEEAGKYVDFIVTDGVRDLATQQRLVDEGKSKTMKSKHLVQPSGFSHAVDIVPYFNGKVDYNDISRYRNIVFFIKGIGAAKGIMLRLGADWNGNFTHTDQTFTDLPHLELEKHMVGSSWVAY